MAFKGVKQNKCIARQHHPVSHLAIASGVLFALGFGYLVTRSIVGQLGTEPGTAAALARSVAHGDLTVAIDLRPGDTSSLMAQLKRMQDLLRQFAGNFQGAEQVHPRRPDPPRASRRRVRPDHHQRHGRAAP